MSKTKVLAGNHFREIDGETADNLQGAINGELFEVTQMYPVYLNTAEFQNEPGAQRSFHAALEVEKIHAKLFQQAQDSVKAGHDIELEHIYICPQPVPLRTFFYAGVFIRAESVIPRTVGRMKGIKS